MRKLLCSLFILPAFAMAATFTNIDDFTQAQNLTLTGAGTVTSSSVTTLAGVFTRTLNVSRQGTGNSNSSIDIADGIMTFHTHNRPTQLSVTYSAIDAGGVAFAAASNLTVDIQSAHHANSFSWVLTDVNGDIATWEQAYATGANTYSKSYSNFIYTTFDWMAVTQLVFGVNLNLSHGTDTTVLNVFTIPGSTNSDLDGAPPIPEPSTYGICLGILALAAAAIRRRKVVA